MRKAKRYAWALLVLGALALGGCAWLLRPLEAKLTATPTSGPAPLSVTFSAAGSTGPIVSFTLDFGDGSEPETGTDLPENIPHTYDTAGVYIAKLTVQDAQGRTATDSVTITVLPGTTASLSASPSNPMTGETVTFILQATAASGRTLVAWNIDYGDGTGDDGLVSGPILYLTKTHSYADPDTYTVIFTVEDNAGATASAVVQLSVTSPPPEITAFKAKDNGNEAEEGETLTIASGTTVTFEFEAAPASGRKIAKWTLATPGANVTEETQTGTWDPLPPTTKTRIYTNTTAQTQSYTATLQVFDDVNNSAQAAITIEVAPAPSP